MAGQVIHYNVRMPERCFPIVPTGKRRETRCDIPQFGLRAAWGREGPFHNRQGGPKVAISGLGAV